MFTRRTVIGSSVSALGSALMAKQVSPVELTRSCLERIRKWNPTLKAFITVMEESALAQAKALETEIQRGRTRGPLHGVPIGVKDLYDTAGVRTTAASKHWEDRVPSADAEVVRRLKDAGAVIIGKTNMDEFAYNFTGSTSFFGQCRNPWHSKRSPGGSSGGSAVAVATGMCVSALGSDTGGSIRLPAALCGITGFKPTYGAVNLDGAATLAWSLDHAGPMCRTALDARILFEAMSGKTVRNVPVRPLRVGIPRAVFYDKLDGEVASITARAIETLARLTSGAKEVSMMDLKFSEAPQFPESYATIIYAEAYAYHELRLRQHADRFHEGTRRTINAGASITAPQYIHARREMDRLRAGSVKLFATSDVLVTPTAPGPAFPIGDADLVFLRNTAPWNLLGVPTISVPCGFTKAGLPVGIQITAAAGRDDAVLALAMAYQNATDWHRRQPALG